MSNELLVDTKRLRDRLAHIRRLIGYETYDVSLILVNDTEMREINHESRGMNASTDILSFPFHPASRPGTLVPPEFDIPDYYNLGDIIVDIPYVIECCRQDQKDFMDDNNEDDDDDDENDDTDATEEEERDGDEYEDEYVDDDRGVSGAMATVFEPEERIHMLLVHGMLHLVGYDHETDHDYEVMVAEEERLLAELGMLKPTARARTTLQAPAGTNVE